AGYEPDTAFLTVTSPKLTNSGLPGSTTTTNPPIGIYIYAVDSLSGYYYYNTHPVLDSVTVMAVSSDTTVLRPGQTYFRIPKGQYYTTTTVNVAGPGTASITYSDSAGSGYVSTTTNSMTVTGPAFGIITNTPV